MDLFVFKEYFSGRIGRRKLQQFLGTHCMKQLPLQGRFLKIHHGGMMLLLPKTSQKRYCNEIIYEAITVIIREFAFGLEMGKVHGECQHLMGKLAAYTRPF